MGRPQALANGEVSMSVHVRGVRVNGPCTTHTCPSPPHLMPVPTLCCVQCESEEPLTGSDAEFSIFSHKRSNSCSADDRLKVNKVRMCVHVCSLCLCSCLCVYDMCAHDHVSECVGNGCLELE